MKLTRREIERIAVDRVMQSYRKSMVRFAIIYAFGLMAICFPVSYFGDNIIGILIFFLGLVLMVLINVVITFYKISPKAKKMANKMFDQMLREENERPEEV
jgi:hypothetical protein